MPVGTSEDLADGDVAGLGELLEVSDALALRDELAGVGLDPPEEDVQEGGLAGAVDTDQADAVPLVYLKTHILQHLDGAERFGYGQGLQ